MQLQNELLKNMEDHGQRQEKKQFHRMFTDHDIVFEYSGWYEPLKYELTLRHILQNMTKMDEQM
jgi:hypothetical protein